MVKYTPAQRISAFWSNVDKSPDEDACWLWTGFRDVGGYGRVSKWREANEQMAHRISYLIAHGEIPKGLHVLHQCDNPSCVNPRHLFLGTNTDNMRDRDEKGRVASGERNGRAKLSDEDVFEILRLTAEGVRQKEIAKRFSVGRDYIWRITTGRYRRR